MSHRYDRNVVKLPAAMWRAGANRLEPALVLAFVMLSALLLPTLRRSLCDFCLGCEDDPGGFRHLCFSAHMLMHQYLS